MIEAQLMQQGGLQIMHRGPVLGDAEAEFIRFTIHHAPAETAAGKFPVETVEQMAQIALEAERAEDVMLDADFTNKRFGRIDQSIAMGALFTAHHLGCKAIIALTESGSTALWMSRNRIHIPIYALTPKVATQRKMAMYRNVRPLLMPVFTDRDQALAAAEKLPRSTRRRKSRRASIRSTMIDPFSE